MEIVTANENVQILRIKDVENLTGLKKSSIYERVRNGGFPKPIKIGPRATGFLKSEVVEWIGIRAQARS